ncbi:O-antigen ligase [Caloranaerobacter azorensis DSM 13643]|uniref:O-antigen ligase n=1 Tax=Caloranaerobacter azorensis DSM 13643 TaxID=1121264 RepID=A0A1M5TKA8_9FIRM|nr:O-antigen ligase family protein [Caloranaerobacter azorensis]SHH51118.1 O-antigen ligase [Caloranaerobacter azorensis DSM 13643]
MVVKVLAGLIAILLSIIDIKIGIGLAIFILPFVPKAYSLIYLISLFMVFIFRQIFIVRWDLKKSVFGAFIFILASVMLISTLTSYNPQGSFRDLVIHFSSLGLLIVMVNNIENKKQLNSILTLFVFTAVLVAIYGLYQYKVGIKLDRAWVDVSINPDINTRVFSVFGNPNILAEYLIMSIPISIALFWFTKKLFKKLIFLVSSLILIGTLILTFSRGGWLGFAFGVLIFVILIEKRLLLSLIPAGVLAIFIMPSTVIHRIATIGNLSDSSNAYRIKVWTITLDIIRDNLITGVGFGYIPFRETFLKYIRTMNVYHAHNMYLETLAEMGIGGFILFILFIFIIYKYAIITLIKNNDRYLKTMIAGVLAGLSSVLFHGLFENILYLPRIIITFWMLISFILVAVRLSKEESKEMRLNNIEII